MTVLDAGWRGYIEQSTSSLKMLGNDALEKLIRDYRFNTVLDLGCGTGEQAKMFSDRGKLVTTIDFAKRENFTPDYVGDYLQTRFTHPFDAIWCCHVLEHVRDVGIFLSKLKSDLKANGVLAITVPPAKHNIVSGHVSIWNAGLLLYNMILAGFDCSKAAVRTYGYNVSVIVTNRNIHIPPGVTELSKLNDYFPIEVYQGFDGRIKELNW